MIHDALLGAAGGTKNKMLTSLRIRVNIYHLVFSWERSIPAVIDATKPSVIIFLLTEAYQMIRLDPGGRRVRSRIRTGNVAAFIPEESA